MTNWKKYKFSDFVNINPLVKLKANEEYSFIEMKDLNDGQRFTYPSTERILTGGARFEEGDTLFARITPCLENGKICQAKGLKDGKGFGSTEFLIFRGKKDVSDSNFVFYLSRWDDVRRFAELHMVGTSGRQRVPKDVFENLELDLPKNLPTQTRIASILSSLDDKIELNRRTNHTLEQIAQTLFKKYFVDDIDPENLPEGWKQQILSQQFDIDKGLSYKGSGLCNRGEGIPMHNLNSIYEGGGYKYEGLKYYKGEYKERHLLQAWDIIVTNTEQGHKYLLIGYPGVVPFVFGTKGIFTHHIYRVRPKAESYLTNQYLYYLIMQAKVRDQIIACTNGTTVNMLSSVGLEKPEFLMPPKEIVEKFTEAIIPIWKMKENIHVENEKLVAIRDSLLPKLMSGEIIINAKSDCDVAEFV